MSYGTRLLVSTRQTQVKTFVLYLEIKSLRIYALIPNELAAKKHILFMTGKIHEDYLREILTTFGDRFTDDQVDDMYKEAPIK